MNDTAAMFVAKGQGLMEVNTPNQNAVAAAKIDSFMTQTRETPWR
jgi:hypothetical protein